MVYYRGEINYDHTGTSELCEYYNAYIHYDSLTSMEEELKCVDDEAKKNSNIKVLNFLDDVPQSISERDLKDGEYSFKGYTEVKYPSTY
jgi:hypothetical protein